MAATLSGCVFSIDAAAPTVRFVNDYAETVVVTVEGLRTTDETWVASNDAVQSDLSACTGTGIRVETEDGELLARIDEQACPGWELTIAADGTVDYQE